MHPGVSTVLVFFFSSSCLTLLSVFNFPVPQQASSPSFSSPFPRVCCDYLGSDSFPLLFQSLPPATALRQQVSPYPRHNFSLPNQLSSPPGQAKFATRCSSARGMGNVRWLSHGANIWPGMFGEFLTRHPDLHAAVYQQSPISTSRLLVPLRSQSC